MMTDFHFIRPLWLLALILSAAIWVLLARYQDTRRQWRGIVADHLLTYVISEPRGHKGLRPHGLLGAVLILTSLALAGPTWVREPAPFADDTAALVIAMEVTPTMLAQDIQPSRLERAAQKIKDLLAKRKGAATALVAYAGSVHLVMPLTEDGDLLAAFAAELHPKIMPAEGDMADRAVEFARVQLARGGRAGSVLLVTDGVSPRAAARIDAGRQQGDARVHVYGVAAGKDAFVLPGSPPAPALDRDNLKAAASAGKGSLVLVTPDGADVERLARIVETQFSAAVNPEAGDRWKDFGYGLVPVIAFLSLWWFRPGWTVRWGSIVLTICFLFGSPSEFQAGQEKSKRQWTTESQSQERNESDASMLRRFDFTNLFQTRDQKAQRLFNKGNFVEAAELFTDPSRQGAAWYRAGEFERAAAAFGRTGTPEGMFNRGNALVMLGNYEAAMKSYAQALQARPGWEAAVGNLALAKARLARLTPPEDQASQKGVGKDDEPDEIVFDDRAKDRKDANTETIAGAGEKLSDAAMRALWLRRVETKPADFLRRKFAYQYRKAREQG